MLITKAARRYATALLELSKDRNEVKSVLGDMQFIHNTLEDSRELVLFFKSPIIKYDDKENVLLELFGDEVQESTRLFLKLLTRKNRINLLDQIARAFIEAYHKFAGIIEIQATVAEKLNESQTEKLHAKLEEITSKKVHLNVQQDGSLRGGMKVRIDDTVIDGSVKHKLQELEEQLLSTSIEH